MADKDKVASIDIHKKVLMVVVGSREGEAIGPQSELERRRFGTMTSELGRLSAWLRERGVKEAVMESTAGYWKPVWMELEPYMCLHLNYAQVEARAGICASALISTSPSTGPILI